LPGFITLSKEALFFCEKAGFSPVLSPLRDGTEENGVRANVSRCEAIQ
jgi:hypothetical protein